MILYCRQIREHAAVRRAVRKTRARRPSIIFFFGFSKRRTPILYIPTRNIIIFYSHSIQDSRRRTDLAAAVCEIRSRCNIILYLCVIIVIIIVGATVSTLQPPPIRHTRVTALPRGCQPSSFFPRRSRSRTPGHDIAIPACATIQQQLVYNNIVYPISTPSDFRESKSV